MANYLDLTGLQSLWAKIKALITGVDDNVSTLKNNYISKIWANVQGSDMVNTNLTTSLSPEKDADGNNGVSDAEIGIFCDRPIIADEVAQVNTTTGHKVKQTLVLRMLGATSEQNGYMSKEDKATIDGLGDLASKDSVAFSEITDKPTTLADYGIVDGVTNIAFAGVGNAITALSLSGHKLTYTKDLTFLTTTAAANTYLTQTNAASTYLPLAGGTLTGNLNASKGFIFQIDSKSAFTVNSAGNVGIGYGYASTSATSIYGKTVVLTCNNANILTASSTGVTINGTLSASGTSMTLNSKSTLSYDNNALHIGYGNRVNGVPTFVYGTTGVRLIVDGTTIIHASTSGVAVTGKITATGAISGNSSSDERKKENIVEADSLAALQTLGGVYDFDYKETGEHSTGFIAQKVQDGMFADIVTEDEEGYKQINYWSPKLIAAAIGAIGQLSEEVTALKAKIAELENSK